MTWTADRWSAIEQLFHAAAEREVSERPEFLATACGGDTALRAAVEQLLAADGADDELLERGVLGALRPKDPLLDHAFGPYRLVERIAEGGMGSVYRAVRVEGEFQQEVAVKVLHLGLSGSRMQERFAQERQTLARLAHPNVARLLDGGTTASGVPFIAMELIDGLPLDRYCDASGASLRQRLELFAVVCRAVQFAHRNLVVHLDLKPSNILVDAHGVPKLLDFGVAGLLEGVAGSSGIAATRSRPLTPEYASPEQLRGEPVSTAADVYALGAVLYELLTGVRPFQREPDAGGDFVRKVCDTEALRPSAAFATAAPAAARADSPQLRAERRSGTAASLARSLRGDLDRMVMLALRHEPGQRYASCQEFADDIDRFLRGFPVIARPPSFGYRLARFARRNRLGVAVGSLAVLTLLGGIVSTLHMASVARQGREAAELARERIEVEKDHARVEATSSRITAAFLGDTFLAADFVGKPEARERLQRAILLRAGQVRREYEAAPHLRANLLEALGRVCLQLDLFGDAEALIAEAAAIRVLQFGKHSLEYALSLCSIGRLRFQEGRFPEAVVAFTECYRLHHEFAEDVHTDVATAANDLAAAVRACGDRERARELHREALALRRAGGSDTVLVAESLNNLANAEDDPARQCELLHEALAIRRRILGDDDPLTLQSGINLARVSIRRRDFATARPLLLDAIAASRRSGDLGSDGLSQALGSLAFVEVQAGDTAAAAAAASEALAIDRKRFGDDHPRVAADLEIQAKVSERALDFAAAVGSWQEVLRIRRKVLPAGHRDIANTLCSLGAALARAGSAEAGVAALREALVVYAAARSPRPTDIADAKVNLGDACEGAGRFDEAERAWLEALPLYQAEATGSAMVTWLRRHLREFYLRRGRGEDAARYAEPASASKL